MDLAMVGATSEPVDPTPRPADPSPFPAVSADTDRAPVSGKPLLSVVIPCYNEVATIASLIERVRRAPVPSKQIIVVDDGSSDGTRDLLAGLQADDLTILFHPHNQGKGAALATGFAAALGEITIVQDADLEYDPEDFPLVIGPIQQGRADVVFGSRFQGGAPHRVVYFWHRLGNGFLTLLSNMFTDLNLSDMETCYKAFRTEIIQSIPIREKRFGFEPEITAKVAKQKWRIYEVGISYYGRTYDEGKKIGWRDGVRAIWCILKYNLWA
jgi:glycosyltransferase involved in cell wall biosynthesis